MHLAAESHVDRSIDGAGGLHRDERRRHARLLEAARAYWGGARRDRPARASASTTSRPTRSSARSDRTTRPSPRRRPTSRARPIRRARRRPTISCAPGAIPMACRSSSPIRTQQLRALSFPREADPADDREGDPRRGPPRLRTRRERARLAPRRGPRGGAHRGGGARARRRDLFHRRRRGAEEPRRGDADRGAGRRAAPDRFPPAAHATRARSASSPDRPGHDFRYAMDISKIGRELGWRPSRSFEEGLRADGRVVSSRTAPGGSRSCSAMPASGSARRKAPMPAKA